MILTASHASQRDDFEITVPETDTMVETLLEHGALGARQVGGGFGGCVIALAESGQVAGLLELSMPMPAGGVQWAAGSDGPACGGSPARRP